MAILDQSQVAGSTLGYAQITSAQSTTSTSGAAISGLTVGITVPAGNRRVKISVVPRDAYVSGTSAVAGIRIYSGASAGALTTQLGEQQINTASSNSVPVNCVAAPQLSAGTIYITAAFFTTNSANAINVEAASAYPAFILVELI